VSGGITPLFLISALEEGECSASRLGRLILWETVTVPIRVEAGWDPEPVQAQKSEEKYLALAGNRTPTVQPIAMLSELLDDALR
jgi:hypothetical protein